MSDKEPQLVDDIESRSHWHLDKRVNLSHIIGTLLLAAAFFSWASGMDSRITVLETKSDADHQTQIEIKDELKSLNQKFEDFLYYVYNTKGKLNSNGSTINK